MTTTSHADHDHEATSSARAACRKATSIATSTREVAIDDLIAAFAAKGFDWDPTKFLFYAASHFASTRTSDPRLAAAAVLDHFLPSDDEVANASRRRNGYLVTTSYADMVAAALRAAS